MKKYNSYLEQMVIKNVIVLQHGHNVDDSNKTYHRLMHPTKLHPVAQVVKYNCSYWWNGKQAAKTFNIISTE